jgi:tRNA (cmo5U34)-methyltransferase
MKSSVFSDKSSVEEIRTRFDADVERFSCLESGQQATIDAPLVLELVANAAATHVKQGSCLLDLGCGAGNFTLKVMQATGPLHSHLVDLSAPMLERAQTRVREAGAQSVQTYQSDLRELNFPDNTFDGILAGAVLHHLREEEEWHAVFRKLHGWLKPGGRVYVADLVYFDLPDVQEMMWRRYGDYLESLGGSEYRDKVFAYIEKEDSPRSLPFQLEVIRAAGFSASDVLHRNSVFACYLAAK